jgi:mannosyltransferase
VSCRGYLRVGSGSFVVAAWTWLLVPLLGLYLISTRVPMFVDRYLIWTAPAFYLLLARGLDQLRQRSAFVAGVCLAGLLTLNGVAIWQQNAEPIKSDFRAAAAYLRQHRRPGELALFHISYVRDTFEYYYGAAVPAADGIPTDEATTPEAVDAAMRERTAGYHVVWLVLSEPEMWDARGMTVAWLDAHGQPTARADFARVSVIRYELTP